MAPRVIGLGLAGAIAGLAVPRAQAPVPTACAVPAIVDRAAATLAAPGTEAIGIIATEDYRQEVVGVPEPDRTALPPIGIRDDILLPAPLAAARPIASRRILASFLLLRDPGAWDWQGYRAVRTVDGRGPADAAPIAGPAAIDAATLGDWRRRSVDGERRLIGPVARRLNVPTAALAALHPAHRRRFTFTAAPAADRSTCRVLFQETEEPSVLRSGIEDDVPASGRFDLDIASARVLASELIGANRGGGLAARTTVRYRRDGIWPFPVPAEMREEFLATTGHRVRGVARYADHRAVAVSAAAAAAR